MRNPEEPEQENGMVNCISQIFIAGSIKDGLEEARLEARMQVKKILTGKM